MYLMDTNIISALRRPDRNPSVIEWLAAQQDTALFLSAITIGEISRGIAQQETKNPTFAADLKAWIDRTEDHYGDRILPFTSKDAHIWGQLSARIGHSGADLMIAATALAHKAIVVTLNVSDFKPTGVDIICPA